MVHGYSYQKNDAAALIETHLELVRKIAFYYRGKVGNVAEVDDLLQLGMVGLVEAAHNYSPKENIPFAAYAKLRIKGAIVDHLRKSSNLCRGTIRRKQDFERAKRKLEKQLNVMLVHYQFRIERMKNFQLFLIYLIEMIVVAHRHMEEHFPQHWTHIFAIDMR